MASIDASQLDALKPLWLALHHHHQVIGVMVGNDRARRFYERRGLVAAETHPWRVGADPRSPRGGTSGLR